MNSQTKSGWKIRWQFAKELFECVWLFVGLALKGLRLLLFVEIKTFLNLMTKLAPLCKHFTLWRINYWLLRKSYHIKNYLVNDGIHNQWILQDMLPNLRFKLDSFNKMEITQTSILLIMWSNHVFVYLHYFRVKDCDNFKGLQRNTYTAQKWFMFKVYLIFAILPFSSLKDSTFETEKNDFYFTSKSFCPQDTQILEFQDGQFYDIIKCLCIKQKNIFYWITWEVNRVL